MTPEPRIFADNPHLAHDLSALRRLTLAHALRESEADEALLEPAFEAFYAARNQVECYPDSLDALQRLAARLPVAALSNGNADLERIGLARHFAFQLGAREHGAAKPDPGIFHLALEAAGTTADRAVHVGDAYQYDVRGARAAGIRPLLMDPLGLRDDVDCERIASLAEVADLLG